MAELPEPWLRGPMAGVSPLVAPILYSFQQAREDLAQHTEGLTTEQVWARPHGFGPVGFHLRHIAGSVERLMTYVQGRQLSEAQLAAIERQMEPGASRDELLAEIDASLRKAEEIVRRIDPATLAEPRSVGRKGLPTTVIGLLTHIAEHTTRHVGEAIVSAKWVRAASHL
jgi:uncharacterized damage-inducible protein DinB